MSKEIRCDVEVQVALTKTGQNTRAKTIRNALLCKRNGGIQVIGTNIKTAIRTNGVELYFGKIHRGILTFIRRENDKYTQYNCSNGIPSEMEELKEFAISQGAVAKTPTSYTTPVKPTKKPLIDQTNTRFIIDESPPVTKKRQVSGSQQLLPTQLPKKKLRKLTSQQLQVIEAIKAKRSLFFTGRAGTGKSFMLRYIQKLVPASGLYCTATTGIAAFHINGMTLHHFAGLTPHNTKLSEAGMLAAIQRKPDALQRWRHAKTLIIDEISMLDGRVFEALDSIARKLRNVNLFFGGIQLVLTGDFYQLPPVADGDGSMYCFETEAWKRGIKESICFEQVFRQSDEEFISILNAVRTGTQTRDMLNALNKRVEYGKESDSIHIFSHNSDVLSMNNTHLEALEGNAREYSAIDSGKMELLNGSPIPSRIQLKKGAKVMLTKTLAVGNGLVNGARGIVLGFTPDTKMPLVRFEQGQSQVIAFELFEVFANHVPVASRKQLPLTLAYAISIHKSQGLTFDSAVLHLSKVFEYGQAYVALSRLSSLTGLTLAAPITSQAIRVHPRLSQLELVIAMSEEVDEVDVGFQAYREKYNQTIAAPNGPLLRVIRAPNDEEIDSKRTELIENAEELLTNDMEELKDATHVRNVEIQKHFDAIKERGRHFEAKLTEETQARDESMEKLRVGFLADFDSAFALMEAKTSEAFTTRLNENIAQEDTREENLQLQFNEFVQVTVPGIIEALQGTITRKLEKSHETFDIDNTKLMKREKKMVNQVETHERKTAQAFVDENERRVSTFINLQEAIHSTMRTDDRQAERKQSSYIDTILALKVQFEEERRVRENEDAELLEKVSGTMERLHVSILESFGEEK